MISLAYIWRLKFRPLIISILFLFSLGLVHAQDVTVPRILSARSANDGSLIIQLEVPETQKISDANIVSSDGKQIALEFDSNELPVENWIILDAGAGAVDIGSAFQSAVETFADSVSTKHSFKLIFVGVESQISDSFTNRSQFLAALNEYNPQINTVACVADAFANMSSDEPKHVLLLVGEISESCPAFAANATSPIDVIQLANNLDESLSNLAKNSAGVYIRGTVQSLGANVRTIESLWNRPVYQLTGNSGQALNSGILNLTLSDNQQFSLDIAFEQIFVAAPTATETSMLGDTIAATDAAILSSEAATQELTEIVIAPDNAVTASMVPTVEISPTPVAQETNAAGQGNSLLVLVAGIAVIAVIVGGALVLFTNRVGKQDVDRTDTVPELGIERQFEKTDVFEESVQTGLEKTEFVSLDDVAASAKLHLIGLLYHEESEITYEIYAPQTILGRKEGVGIYIGGDRQISREHLKFTQWPDQTIWVTRLTHNPVLLNEKPIEKHEQLKSGDVLQLSTKLRLRFQEVKKDD